MNFWETLAIATIPAMLTAGFAYLRNRIDLLKYKADSMAERSAKHFMNHKGYTDRKFETIKKYLGGWDNDEDELRKILVRAGAIRIFRKEQSQEIEYWTLLTRESERIKNLKTRQANK
jgi:5-bromo-4-chloroindolyl phosphate hydrolysis protein